MNLGFKASAHSLTLRSRRRRIFPSRTFCLPLQILLLSSMTFLPVILPAQTKTPSEYELKAAFIFNFAKFVEWPPRVFDTQEAPFLICVLGTDPFGGALDAALLHHSIQGRPVALLRLKRVADIEGCQILFVAISESHRLPEITDKVRGQCVLVIGESENFAASGGVIQFSREENRIRFVINTDAADRSGLKFSSKLLALAKIVRDSPAGGGD